MFGKSMSEIKVRFLVLLVIPVFMLLCHNAAAQADKNALRFLEMEQYNQARSAFVSALKTGDNAANWFYLGKIYAIRNKADSARYCFSRMSATDSKSILNLIGQAIGDYITGNKTQALLTLEKAQRNAIASRDVNAMAEIAEARFNAGDTLKWTITLELASGMDKRDSRSYVVAGNLYSVMGDTYNRSQFYGLASGRYHQALYLQPNNVEALSRLAAINIKIRNYDDAESMLTKALATDPLYLPALKNLGELYYILGRYSEASVYSGQYIKLAEYSEKDLTKYINILYFNKEYDAANEYVNKILISNPSNPVMLRLKGYTAFELGQYQAGVDAMSRFFAVRSVVDTSKVIALDYEYYGKLLAKTGNDTLAIANLLKAMEVDTTKTVLLDDVAKLYEKQKKYPEAIICYGKLIQYKRNDTPSLVYFSLGKDLLILADYVKAGPDSALRQAYLERADSAFSKVISLSPGSYLGFQWRARTLAGLDPETSLGLAKADYEKALALLESKNDTKKYASDLIEGYRYLGYFYYLQYEATAKTADATAKDQAKSASMANWQKILLIDPANEVAKQAIGALK